MASKVGQLMVLLNGVQPYSWRRPSVGHVGMRVATGLGKDLSAGGGTRRREQYPRKVHRRRGVQWQRCQELSVLMMALEVWESNLLG
jgi:hypothetical protein